MMSLLHLVLKDNLKKESFYHSFRRIGAKAGRKKLHYRVANC